MYGIKIRTVGEVAFRNRMQMSSGYFCDVPTDQLGFPCLPLATMLSDYPCPVQGIRFGFAHPEGYLGLVREACALERQFPNDREYIRALYTREHYSMERVSHIRSLKSGQSYVAAVWFRPEDEGEVTRFLQKVKQIGITDEGVTGEVEMTLCRLDEEPGRAFPLNPLCSYRTLDYTIHLMTPASLHAPYEDGAKTYLYIPGGDVRAVLSEAADEKLSEALEGMRFSHAYIAGDGERLYPVPLCMSVVKLDKEQLRYRLSPGKDPARIEQNVTLYGAYTDNFLDHFMRYIKPETERINTDDGTRYEALSAGQAFRGTVYGTDEQIRLLAAHLREHSRFSVGKATEDGYGEACLELCGAREEVIRGEELSACFDAACLSDTLLLDDEGMPSCRAEEMLREMERLLGIPGGLEIVGRYTEVYKDFRCNYSWNQDGPVVRCLKAGSVLRIRTKDGKPVNIFPLRHCFIGENTRNGYGEMAAYPATDMYYRVTEQAEPPKYTMRMPTSYEKMGKGAKLVLGAMQEKLKSLVRGMAAVDRWEVRQGIPAEDILPGDLLSELRETFAPDLEKETVLRWYRDGLEDEPEALTALDAVEGTML